MEKANILLLRISNTPTMVEGMRLCQLLDLWMRQHKLSVRELAREIGIGYTVLHDFRHGEDCNSTTLAKILSWVLSHSK